MKEPNERELDFALDQIEADRLVNCEGFFDYHPQRDQPEDLLETIVDLMDHMGERLE